MNNRRDNSAEFLLVCLWIAIPAIAVCLLVLKFSNAVGLDFQAGCQLLLGLIAGAAILCAAWWWQENNDGFIFTVKNVLPASLAVIWLGFWSALQQWGSVGRAFHGHVQDVAWWANGFTRWGVLLIIVSAGYSYVCRTRDGY
ncbi:hypothetical protein QNL30_25255 [Pseudomonas amygdali pv. morsprunorum]|uniref:Transmembrane protein n=1 Tax=Pseudomonas amygdali pv. morsprunorum TaxID=129138 RepID=A0AB35R880_PSEA0|nr:hypothetical protein [Pseudomonas amygdali]MDT3243890.1 hypothetical protein [Pseudomonas amygdali pv. morsprunorum]